MQPKEWWVKGYDDCEACEGDEEGGYEVPRPEWAREWYRQGWEAKKYEIEIAEARGIIL